MTSVLLRRAWLDDQELDLATGAVSHEQGEFLRSWSVALSLASFPAADILNLKETEFRGEAVDGRALSGHAIVANVQVTSRPALALRGSGPLDGW